MIANTPEMQLEYQRLFDTCIITPSRYSLIDTVVERINSGQWRYKKAVERTDIPWYLVGIIHILESGGKFTTHLHNGDPLTARTVHVPKNRPAKGTPPFLWEDSAKDALEYRKLHKVKNWTVPELLFQLEGYNGFGYRRKGIFSPYLWSYSNHYVKGKYTSDGVYDPNAVSRQVGAAVMLRRLSERQQAIVGEFDNITRIKALGEMVKYNVKKKSAIAAELQRLLNLTGQPLKIDGYAGRFTSDAFRRITGRYLKGDPKKR